MRYLNCTPFKGAAPGKAGVFRILRTPIAELLLNWPWRETRCVKVRAWARERVGRFKKAFEIRCG